MAGQIQITGDSTKAAGEQQPQTAAPVDAQQPPEPARYEHPCSYPQTREDSDLCAQWVAAVAARESVAVEAERYPIEVGAMAASGVTAILALVAAWQGFRAFRSQKRTEIAQTRAYLFPESVSLSGGVPIKGSSIEVSPPGAVIILKNSGNTPASDVRHWGLVELAEDPSHLQRADMATAPKSMLPPGGIATYTRYLAKDGGDLWVTPVGAEIIQNGSALIFVHGRIEYRDVYGSQRFTNYRLEYCGSWPPPDGTQMRFSLEGNDSD